ncbi:MAG: hypothetical protein WD689_02750 [Gaiellaceae bacterium]
MIAIVAAAIIAAASPVVDSTVECSVAGGEGYPDPPPRYLNVIASPLLSGWPPSVNTWDRQVGLSIGFRTRRSPQHTTGSVWIDRVECRATRVLVPLSSRGLRQVDARLGARYRCDVPAKVLVRVRAVFTRPVTLLPQRGYLMARGTISTGSIAVRTRTGRPIFLGSAQDRGKTTAFVARGRCSR